MDKHADLPRRPLWLLQARPVGEVLAALHDAHQRRPDGTGAPPPLLTLHLRSGRDVRCLLIDLQEAPGPARWIVGQVPGPNLRQPDSDVIYLAESSIEAVTVHGAEGLLHVLSDGRIEVPPDTPPPSRLEIRRRLAGLSQRLSGAVGAALAVEVSGELPEAPEALHALLVGIEEAATALLSVAQDELGREALARKLQRICFTAGAAPGVGIQGTDLVIIINPQAGRQGRLSLDALGGQISAIL